MNRIIVAISFLLASSISYAEKVMPSDVWVTNFKSIAQMHLCTDESAHFLDVYKGTTHECFVDVAALYKSCTSENSNVVIPEVLRSKDEANKYGKIVVECISANYMGGEVLEAFNLLQESQVGT